MRHLQTLQFYPTEPSLASGNVRHTEKGHYVRITLRIRALRCASKAELTFYVGVKCADGV